ncbi:MAG: PAS domain-containing protein [Candidatus Thermoplasmatota archaeon]
METYDVLFVNKYLKDLLGEDPVGKKCYQMFDKLDHPCDFCTNDKILENPEKAYRWEYHNEKLKRDFIITDKIIEWPDGRKVRFELAIDITEFKKTQRKLKRSEERFRLAQKAAEIGSWEYNIKTEEIKWSDQIEPIFGLKKGEFEGTFKDFIKRVHPEDRELIKKEVEACIKKGKDYDIEHRIIQPDGTIRWVREMGDVFKDEKDRPNRMLGIVQDITERKKTERKINELTKKYMVKAKKLSETNKELEAFSYSVSHDLSAPLRSINGFSEALIEDYQDLLDEEGKDYLFRIKKSADKMSELIDGLLKLSRLIRTEINPTTINLADIAREIIDDLEQNNPKRNVEFKIKDKEEMYVKGDLNLLKVLLENLIGNALKFTGQEENPKIIFGTKKSEEKKTIFYVKDNGTGFNMDYSDKLFIPFQRLHKEKEFSGKGIGLSIVQRIIKRHNGEIWAKGKKDEGATFYFTIED